MSDNERLHRPSGLRSLRLGETKVTYVPDGAVPLTPRGWLPDTTDAVWAAHPEYLDGSGNLVASIGGLLVETRGRALLIDAGFGPLSLPAETGDVRGTIHGGALLDNLAELGRRPEDIEAVAFTHLHIDHLGWALHPALGGDRPAFAHADYLVTEPEWSQRHLLEAHGTSKETLAALEPYVRTTSDGQEIFPGVRVRFIPGHTPGHAAYVITAGGKRLIAFGDALHSPIQVAHPEWGAAADHDTAQSADFRRRLVAELQEPDTIGFGIHFADVVFGQVRPGGDSLVWRPVDA
ncbi:MBL fold metallo-hydrolase [Streptomyces sp. NBS 14/10]|uniref:MBL fold metallo-hydrolase n=1 Tax=Streptomyces sp. NBS 14/10 TaxID=1945643 RepID=UPI0015C5CFD2|nr:MBL fold metallo-hydrolase [Streptomyces sp. NBS 14/10]KAK1179771.1 MBL fold metallo-hydrolase [Streptomyces sp. NBS 14/10]